MHLMKIEEIMKITHVTVMMMIMIKPLLLTFNRTYFHLCTNTLVRANERPYWEFEIYYLKSRKTILTYIIIFYHLPKLILSS